MFPKVKFGALVSLKQIYSEDEHKENKISDAWLIHVFLLCLWINWINWLICYTRCEKTFLSCTSSILAANWLNKFYIHYTCFPWVISLGGMHTFSLLFSLDQLTLNLSYAVIVSGCWGLKFCLQYFRVFTVKCEMSWVDWIELNWMTFLCRLTCLLLL